jgi:Flp pilus assembly protein TadD
MKPLLRRSIVGAALFLGAIGSPVMAQTSDASDTDWRFLLSEAELATSVGRYVQADAMLDTLEVSKTPENLGALAIARAELFMATGDVAGATSALGKAGPDAGSPCRRSKLSGWIAGKGEAWNKAILMLSLAIETCSEDASIWNLLGLALIAKQEHVASLEAFDSALILEPRNPALRSNRAMALVAAGKFEAAFYDLREALAIQPDSAIIQGNVDYLSGMLGISLMRKRTDSDTIWGQRLAKAGEGARNGARTDEATALFANATLLQDRFDPRIWSLGSPTEEKKAE